MLVRFYVAAASLFAMVAVAGNRPDSPYGDLPLSFEPNQGQFRSDVLFAARMPGIGIQLREDSAMLSLGQGESVTMRWPGRNRNSALSGERLLPGRINYFPGNDPRMWRTGIPSFSRVRYSSLRPGIDLVFYGTGKQLEYDVVLAAGAKASGIVFQFDGAIRLELGPHGELIVHTRKSHWVQRAPIAYQDRAGARAPALARYVLLGGNRAGFALEGADPRYATVIDPVIEYSLAIGGAASGYANAIAVDPAGNAYIVGSAGAGFPITGSAYQNTNKSSQESAFIAKIDASGTALVYSTYLGGSFCSTGAKGIALDISNNAYVTGLTSCADFPSTPGAYRSQGGQDSQAFVAKLNATGSALLYSALIGGSGYDAASSIALDSAGAAYVAGYTLSSDFPTTPSAFRRTGAGDFSGMGFIAKLSANAQSLVYSTLLGPGTPERVVVDAAGSAYAAGAGGPGFPTTAGVFQPNLKVGATTFDAFVLKLNPDGSALSYSTFLGGGNDDQAYGLALDTGNSVWVAGYTRSSDFPTTAGAFQRTYSSGRDAFLAKINPAGSAILYSTLYSSPSGSSGPGDDVATGVALDGMGNPAISGWSDAPGTLPLASPVEAVAPFLAGAYGTTAVFTAKFNPQAAALLFASYLGAGKGNDVAVSTAGDIYVTGWGAVPVTAGAQANGLNSGGIFAARAASSPACGVSLSRQTVNPGAAASTLTVDVTAAGGCNWVVVKQDNWVTVTAGQAGTGNGTVTLAIATNTGAARAGLVSVGGSLVTINQPANCVYALDTTSKSFPPVGGAGDILVTSPKGCPVSRSTDSAWITLADYIPPPDDTYRQNYWIAENAGVPRTGTITISGLTYTVTQAGNFTCAYSIAPSSVAFPSAKAGSDLINVNTETPCSWTAQSQSDWITIPGLYQSGKGAGYLLFSVTANLTGAARTGTVLVAGKTLTLTQPFGNQPPNVEGVVVGTAGTRRVIALNLSDKDDAVDISRATLLIGRDGNPAGACNVEFDAAARTIRVGNDAGAGFGPAVRLGTYQASVGNSQCTVDAELTNTSANGSSLGISYYVTLSTGFTGALKLYASATDQAGVSTGMRALGALNQGASTALGFYPLTPCRMADTRPEQGKATAFGPPLLPAYLTREFPLVYSGCGVPESAQAFSLNMTVHPQTGLDWLSAWPAGDPYPGVSTLNAPGGGFVANAAIVPIGVNGGISVVGGQPTDLIIDVNGYFAPASAQELLYYPVTPCRAADTRADQGKTGAFGPPALSGYTRRDFPLRSSPCGIPAAAQVYALNMTVFPHGPLSFLSMWPAGQPYPGVSTLNSSDGGLLANMAIVPAGDNGAVTVVTGEPADVIIDVNGYFAPPSAGGLHFYPLKPCRVADTRPEQGKTGAFGPPRLSAYSQRDFPVKSSACNVPAEAQAYSLNMTVIPPGPVDFLSMWPAGGFYPGASTLNSPKGRMVANAAIIPAGNNGAITVVVGNPTDLVIDINGYFAP